MATRRSDAAPVAVRELGGAADDHLVVPRTFWRQWLSAHGVGDRAQRPEGSIGQDGESLVGNNGVNDPAKGAGTPPPDDIE
jgi:hypothetical protein